MYVCMCVCALYMCVCLSVICKSLYIFSLNPYSFDVQTPTIDNAVVANDNFPLGAIPLFVTGSQEYTNSVVQVVQKLNSVYSEFIQSEEGNGFTGQVFLWHACVCVCVCVCACFCLYVCVCLCLCVFVGVCFMCENKCYSYEDLSNRRI